MGEDICKIYFQQRTGFQNIQITLKTQQKEHKQPYKKLSKQFRQILSQRYTDGK